MLGPLVNALAIVVCSLLGNFLIRGIPARFEALLKKSLGLAILYFGIRGSLENQRIAFSRGERFLNQMTPRGRIKLRSRDYSLQNLWEEAVGGLESYSSNWSDVTITGMYVQ